MMSWHIREKLTKGHEVWHGARVQLEASAYSEDVLAVVHANEMSISAKTSKYLNR